MYFIHYTHIIMCKLFFLLFPTLVHAATLVLLRPLQEQRPRIARPSSLYSWSFDPSSFGFQDNDVTDPQFISYSATGLPPWLTLHQDTLSFAGNVPSTAVSSSSTIIVTASVAGQAINDTVQLLILSEPEPRLAIPIAQQILSDQAEVSSAFVVGPGSALAPYFSTTSARDGKAGVRIPPGWSFSIGLQGGTFMPWPLSYQASLANGTSLPDWIRFDPSSFTFNGVVPFVDFSELELLIMATDAAGYSTSATDSFWLTVAADELGLRNATAGVPVNVTIGEHVDVEISDDLMRNAINRGGSASPLGIEIISSDGIAFDLASRRLTGPIVNGSVFDIPMNIVDAQNATLHTRLHLIPVPSLFMTPNQMSSPTLPPPGEESANTNGEWTLSLKPFLSETGLTQMSKDQVKLFAWLGQPSNVTLHLEQESLTLFITHQDLDVGRHQRDADTLQLLAPPSRSINLQMLVSRNDYARPPSIDIVVIAFSSIFNTNSTLRLEVNPIGHTDCRPSDVTCPSTFPSPITPESPPSHRRRNILAAILVATILAILFTAMVITCICIRNRCAAWVPCISHIVPKSLPFDVRTKGDAVATEDKPANLEEIEIGVTDKQTMHLSSIGTLAETRSDHPSITSKFTSATSQRTPNDYLNDKQGENEMQRCFRKAHGSSQPADDAVVPGAGISVGDLRWQVEPSNGGRAKGMLSVESGTTPATGNTVPKHAFFAHVRSPLSSPVHSKPPSISGSPPRVGIFNGIVPILKASSFGSLLGHNKPASSGDSSNSSGVLNCPPSQESRDALKATISKPRLIPQSSSVQMEYGVDGSRNQDGVSRQTSDDGGVGFQAGTAIVYPKEICTTKSSSKAVSSTSKPPLDSSVIPTFILEPLAILEEIPTLLRKRSNESEAAGYLHGEEFGTSSQSTIDGGIEEELAAKVNADDISHPRNTEPLPLDAQVKRSPTHLLRKAVYISESLKSGSMPCDVSSDSVVLATATLAVRSPHPASVKLVPSPRPTFRSSLEDFKVPSSPLTELASSDESSREKPSSKSRLVKFVNEVHYDAGSSSDGGYRHGCAANVPYEGTRERSQTAVVGGLSGTPPSSWNEPTTRSTQSRIPVMSQATSMRLVDQVLHLRSQSRQNRANQQLDQVSSDCSRMSPREESETPCNGGTFHDPRGALWYGHTDHLVSEEESSTSGYHPSPMYHAAGSNPNMASNKPLQVSSGDDTDEHPPQIPLPALPSHSSNYFDLSESSSASSSDSAVIRHTGGMDRILVGAREPFHFLAPVRISHSSPGKVPRSQLLGSLRKKAPLGKFVARHAAGNSLPPWLNFDERLVEFWGVPNVEIRGQQLEIVLWFGDGAQNQEMGRFIIEVVGH